MSKSIGSLLRSRKSGAIARQAPAGRAARLRPTRAGWIDVGERPSLSEVDCVAMLVREKDPIGPSNVRASAVTAPSTAANSDLARPRNVALWVIGGIDIPARGQLYLRRRKIATPSAASECQIRTRTRD